MAETNYLIRKANLNDKGFLAEAILRADLGEEGIHSSYAALFGLQFEDARDRIAAMMEEEMDGCEFSPVHFLVAELNHVPVACVAGWIEGADGVSSWMVRSALMQQYYPKEAMQHVMGLKHLTDQMMVHRSEGNLQIESVFVQPEHRGNGLAAKLIKAHVARLLMQEYPVENAELMTYIHNKKAIRAYEKMGFAITAETFCQDPDVCNYFPDNGMVLMQASIHRLMKS